MSKSSGEENEWWRAAKGRRGGLTIAMAKAFVAVLDGEPPKAVDDAARERIFKAVSEGHPLDLANSARSKAIEVRDNEVRLCSEAKARLTAFITSNPEPPKPPNDEEEFNDARSDDEGADGVREDEDNAERVDDEGADGAGDDEDNAERADDVHEPRARLSLLQQLTPGSRASAVSELTAEDQRSLLLAFMAESA